MSQILDQTSITHSTLIHDQYNDNFVIMTNGMMSCQCYINTQTHWIITSIMNHLCFIQTNKLD